MILCFASSSMVMTLRFRSSVIMYYYDFGSVNEVMQTCKTGRDVGWLYLKHYIICSSKEKNNPQPKFVDNM